MVVFSIVMLVLILFGIQHFLNWLWRKIYGDDSLFVLGILATVVGGVISYVLIGVILIWGKGLL